jgi:Probable cobalt transporter subunit (CbtB)
MASSPSHALQGASSAARRGAISISTGNQWLIGTVLVVAMLYYLIGVDQGAYSIFGNSMFIHEFVHDARHLLGFPCH